ncbi:hypothetical protein [Ruminococcus flavefaciens]|uniref:hypothetical protein n=1 Tax=Ruminococcus flavefaciens TaxID=1265 RepID=UPI0026F18805|nr:hypothetical protein [Ruminococcus flavefaciens]
MKTSVLDFIDSDTLREHLSNQTLEPAIECILIVRSRKCSIEKKLEALKERYDTYSKEDFNKGTYYCREKNFKSALKEYIDSMEKVLADIYRPDNNHVYNAHATDDIGFHGTFDTFEAAIAGIKDSHSENEFCIVKARINEFENVTDITALINEQGELYDLWNLYNDSINWSIYSAYAWIPHRYGIGDIVVFTCCNTFAVVVEDNKCPLTTTGLDMNDMSVRCVIFEKNAFHSSDGVFIRRNYSLLRIESCKESGMEGCPKELIRFNNLIKGGISAAEFLEEPAIS